MNPRIVIVGGGVAGLSAAHWLLRASGRAGAPTGIVLVEAAPRLGGKVATERIEGFLVEAGADSFSDRRPGVLELVEELGLGPELLPTAAGARVLVLCEGRLEELPAGLQLVVPTDLRAVLRSPLLSPAGRARVALDLLRRPRRGGGREAADEAVAPFLRRHFGGEYLDRVAGPLLAGIHATDPERLSLLSALPALAGMARRHGSLIRAARRLAERGAPSRVTLAGGVGSLVAALARRLEAGGVELVTGRPVMDLRPLPRAGATAAGGFGLTLADGARLEADAVVLAAPPPAAAALVAPFAPQAADRLRAIPLASTATVSLGFRREDVRHPLDALGFLVPAREGRPLAACTFSSSKFPGRAPEGAVLVRAYLGTASASGGPELPAGDAALVALALAELEGILGLAGAPLLTRVHRFPAGNPRYLVGHRERLAALEAALPPGLALAGGAYHGVGIPDCVASGRHAAERALAGIRG